MTRRLCSVFALGLCLAAPPVLAQTILARGSGFVAPTGVALDGAGNLFVADSLGNAVKEIPAAGGYATVKTLTGAGSYGPSGTQAVIFDGAGNLFYGDSGEGVVYEALAESNFQTVKRLAGGFVQMQGLAVDAADNVFVASGGGSLSGTSGLVSEIVAAGGYATVRTVLTGLNYPTGIAVDASENIFVSDSGADQVYEFEAAGGYTKKDTIFPGGNQSPEGLALDAQGNLYVCDQISGPFPQAGLVVEVFAAGGYTNYKILANTLTWSSAISLDAAGDIFIADGGVLYFGSGNTGAIRELPAGSSTVVTLSTALPYVSSIAVGPQGNLFIGSGSVAGVTELSAADSYAVTNQYLADGFSEPQSVAVDSAGNLYVADTFHGAVKEILAAGDYTSVQTLATGFIESYGVAVDGAGDVFVTDQGNLSIKEIPAGGGAVKVLSRAFSWPTGIASDSAGNLFVSDLGRGTVSELEAAGGYQTVTQIGPSGIFANGLGLDGAGNLFLARFDQAVVQELQKSGGYQTLTTVANGFVAPEGVAVDSAGDVFVADESVATVPEILPAPPTMFAAILPGSRSTLLTGPPATVFVTLINAAPEALTGCSVGLDYNDGQLVALGYQQTDPTNNTPIGTPDTPFTIPGNNGSVSLLLSFTGLHGIQEQALAPVFGCTEGATRTAVPVIPGVSTLDLNQSDTPTPDIIALAVAGSGGVLSIPGASGVGAFALASIDNGIAGTVLAAAEASDASLPITVTICPTDPTNGACTAPPAASTEIAYAANGTQTYSVFATATGPIAFSPAISRIFVHFADSKGDNVGSTSVAVETQ